MKNEKTILRKKQSKVFLFLSALLISTVSVFAQNVVWEENFDGPEINKSNWTYDVGGGGFGNGEFQFYSDRPENARIESGNLVIEARREAYEGNQFTSARLKSLGRFSYKYGTLEARVKLPNVANGLWPAFWLMGSNFGVDGWPKCGEWDIMEVGYKAALDAGTANKSVSGAMHWWHETGTWGTWLQADASASTQITGNFYDDYHIFRLVWDATHVEISVDNNTYFNMPITDPNMTEFRDNPAFILLNLAVGGSNFVQITDPAQITAPFPAKMLVDYIRLIDNGSTQLFFDDAAKQTGNYGVYTETTPVNANLQFGTDANLYLWNNMTVAAATPFEGSNVMSYTIGAGNWWGMGILAKDKNMVNYSDGYLRFHAKTTTTESIGFGISSTAAGEGWLDLVNGGENFGLIRDGQWHAVAIPLNRFGNIDFQTIKQLFMMKGAAPGAAFNIAIDNIYWSPSVARPTPTSGNFAIYSENAPNVGMRFNPGTDGNIYVWANTLTALATTPYEGSNVLSFKSNNLGWFGLGITANVKYDLSAYKNTNARLNLALKTSSNTTFRIGVKSGNVDNIGQKWITFAAGADPYGFTRNGQWQQLSIPMSDIYSVVDLSQVSQLFELLGTTGEISDIAIDNIYISGAVSTNIPPAVSITAPANGAVYTAPAGITINANASDSDGSVSKVDFYNGTTLLGTDNTSPYSYTWTGVAAGNYSITVKATDNGNLSTTSASVSVTVNVANTPPTVGITSPANGATYTAPASITINATAADANGTVTSVAFYNGTTLLSTDNTSPYSYTWTNVAAGIYSITARATDNGGLSTTSATVSVTVNTGTNTPPTVSITSPANNATFTAPASITINATAADANGTVSSVAFYNGATLLGTDNTSPYSYAWTNVAAGTYSITARATDNGGATTTSVAVSLTVTTLPVNNLALNKPVTVSSTEIAGTPGNLAVDGNAGTRWSSLAADPQWIYVDLGASYNVNRVKVTWETACASNYVVEVSANATSWTNVKTITGNTVLANDHTGLTATGRYIRIYGTTRVTVWGYSIWELEVYGTPVTTNVPPTVAISSPANGATFTAPASITVNATAADSDGTVSSVAFYNGATLLGTDNTSPYSFSWTNVAAGTYSITARATDNGGATTTSSAVSVTVNTGTNTPPTVSITSPANNATFTAPASITINATAADANGTVSSVAFYNGATLLGTDNTSPYSYAWTNVAAGTYSITARATDNGGATTTSAAVSVTVTTLPVNNLALNKPVTVSSTENAGTPGNYAVDGNAATRWASAASDPQWIYVDLGASYAVNRVKITWETACASNYTVQVSANATTWTTIKTISGNTVLVNDHTGLTGTGRYVRISGTTRATVWGYSIFELEVYGTPANVPFLTRIEAESYTAMNGIQTEATSDAGGGLNVGWIDANDWMDYSVTIPAAGTYNIDYRVASVAGGGSLQLRSGATTLATTAIGATGGWQVWNTLTTSATLSAGTQTIRLFVGAGGFNLNWMDIYTTGAKTSSQDQNLNQISEFNVSLHPNPVSELLTINASSEIVGIAVYDVSGRLWIQEQFEFGTSQTIEVIILKAGIYFIKIEGLDNAEVKKFMKQ